MVAKSVPLSVRLSREDAAYIAALKAPEAVTMSEKVRYLVSKARMSAERGETFEGVVEQTEDTLAPLKQALDKIEQDHGVRSALLRALIVALPRILAELEAARVGDAAALLENMEHLEASSAGRIKDLLDQLARLSVTQEAPCLDPMVLRKTVAGPLIELIEIIKASAPVGQ